MSYFSYLYIDRQNRNEHLRDHSRFFESLEVLQSRIDDLKMTSRPVHKTKAPLALIAVDDDSIEEIGRWPWSRTTIAEITNEVLANGAKTITYDAMFSEPERENPLADQTLGETVARHADQVILGTASSGKYASFSFPYQDLCTAEAFLYLGGDKIVTLNTTFVVDDQTQNYDDYKWNELFHSIFTTLDEDVEKQFLESSGKNNLAELSLFQKNALRSQKNREVYNYCFDWLTPKDDFLAPLMFAQILPIYEQTFKQKLDQAGFDAVVQKIKKLKAHPVPQRLGWYSNTPAIQDKSKYTAAFNTKLDSDGFIRRYPLFYRAGAKVGSSYIPSLALQTYLVAQNYRAEVGIADAVNKNEKVMTFFKIFDVNNDKDPLYSVPIDSFSQIRLNYYGPENSFYYVSAKELLTKNQKTIEVKIRNGDETKVTQVDKKEFFKDRSVLVGATAIGIYDIRNTPVQNAMPGPEIQLTALANLFERNFILDIPQSVTWMPVATLVIGMLFTLVWSWGSAVISFAIFNFSAVVLVLVDYYIFAKLNYMLTNWSLFAVFVLTFISVSLYKYFSEERNKSKVRKAFSKYVSPAVVEELLKNEKNLELGGSKKNLTVLFSDLRGFTTFSEKLDPKRLGDFLNLYLTRMTEEIYKTNGTVDKFIGDAIMAFYGAPVPNERHAKLACRCALQSVKKLEGLNLELKDQSFPRLEMGMGINSGEVNVGNMGSATIQNYTVMGDAVNLASRLEGLTRVYGNFIILGPLTYESVKDEFVCREIDQVVVKGKTTAIHIYDLVYEGRLLSADEAWLHRYEEGRRAYTSGDFAVALGHFEAALSEKANDRVSDYFIKKCKDLITNPPNEAWTGINHLREK